MNGYYYYVRATYFDPKTNRQEQAFSGSWPSYELAFSWGTKHYAALPGAFFQVVKSRSRDREVARCEERTNMIDGGEGNVPEVLNVKFRNQNKKGVE